MDRFSYNSVAQPGALYRRFDDDDLIQFSGGFLPRRSFARLAAMNFARIALNSQVHLDGEELISHMSRSSTIEEVKEICHHWSSRDDLLVYEIIQRPGFAEYIEQRQVFQHIDVSPSQFHMVEVWLRDMLCHPKASAAILDNGFNMVTCLKVRIPGGVKYLVYDPQATGSGPTKYTISTSTSDIARLMVHTITNTPTRDAHRLDFARFMEMKLREALPYARGYPSQQLSSQSRPSSINPPPPFVLPESEEDIIFQDTISRVLRLSLQDTGRTNTSSAGHSTANRTRRYQSDQRSNLPDVIPSEQEQLDRITESYIAEVCEATRPSASKISKKDNASDDVGSPTNTECGICMDNHAENMIIRIAGCRHVFCKACVQQTVKAGLKSNIFPIHCPTCAAVRGSTKQEIDEKLVRRLGLREKYIRIFEKLQKAAVGIEITCPRCKESAFVDREVYRSTEQIICPAGCGQNWCKRCQQPIESGGRPHSCDGSAELRLLCERNGWKNCPGCNTLIEKTEGCNHMTCKAPACNTHFCYACGDEIIRSTDSVRVSDAVRIHNERCVGREPRNPTFAGLDRFIDRPRSADRLLDDQPYERYHRTSPVPRHVARASDAYHVPEEPLVPHAFFHGSPVPAPHADFYANHVPQHFMYENPPYGAPLVYQHHDPYHLPFPPPAPFPFHHYPYTHHG